MFSSSILAYFISHYVFELETILLPYRISYFSVGVYQVKRLICVYDALFQGNIDVV
jgi:hypothetical protein